MTSKIPNEIYEQLAKEFNIPKQDVQVIVTDYWKAISTYIKSINLLEYKTTPTDIYLPKLGFFKINLFKVNKYYKKDEIDKC